MKNEEIEAIRFIAEGFVNSFRVSQTAVYQVTGLVPTKTNIVGMLANISGKFEKDYYRMLKDWDHARATYQQAQKLDPVNFLIAERLGDLKLAEMDERMKALASDPNKRAELEELRKQRMAFAVEEYERRVKADFLEQLHRRYDKMLADWQACPVIRLRMSRFDCMKPDDMAHLAKQVRSYVAV